MKPFLQYISEGRDAPLYHATTMDSFVQIIHSRGLKPSLADDPELAKYWGVSTTRNIRFAKSFNHHSRGEQKAVIFQLDQTKLSQRYRIIPYNWDHMNPELGGAGTRVMASPHSDIKWNVGYYIDREDEVAPPAHEVSSEYEELVITGGSRKLIPLVPYVTAIIPVGLSATKLKSMLPADLRHLVTDK